jgi:uncharacterized damage-inducible protein DinB
MAKSRADMFLDLADDPREDLPHRGDERQTLLTYLRSQRMTLEIKCTGLDARQMALRSVEPSTMSLLGLVRHLADTERGWIRRFLAGEDAPNRFSTADEPDGDFDGATGDPALVDEAWRAVREEAAFTGQWVDAHPDLAASGVGESNHPSVREVLVHLIEEYARHNGHADLLRERIDGRIGQ